MRCSNGAQLYSATPVISIRPLNFVLLPAGWVTNLHAQVGFDCDSGDWDWFTAYPRLVAHVPSGYIARFKAHDQLPFSILSILKH